MTNRKFSALIMAALSLAACSSERPDSKAGDLDAGVAQDAAVAERTALTKRPFEPLLDGEWIGNGISYGAFRDGEGGVNVGDRAIVLDDRARRERAEVCLGDAGQHEENWQES